MSHTQNVAKKNFVGRHRRRQIFPLRVVLAILAILACVSSGSGDDAIEGDSSHSIVETPEQATGHQDPVTPVLLGLSIVLLAAKAGGAAVVRLKQPAVLGELLVGVLLGNLVLFGNDGLEFLRPGGHHEHATQTGSLVALTLDMLARIGVILLLFEVGLESTVGDMVKVGWSSLLVGIVGVLTPFGLGWLVGSWLLPNHSWHVHLFLGATLSATSVGITARVFKDLGKSDTDVAKIVLGAAVIDDILGLVLLAVVQAIIVQGTANGIDIAWIVGKALIFLFGSVVLGEWMNPYLFKVASRLQVHGMLMVSGLVFCFALSWGASLMGLAPIVGAFAAGMILDEKHYGSPRAVGERSLEEWIMPVTTLLVPIFFVMMGFQVDLRSFRDVNVLILAAGLTVAAIVGKQACSLGALGKGIDRLSIGFGMIPRGEVGLIFAAIGQGLVSNGKPVIEPAVYSAVVVMVMITTFITPPLLSWSLQRHK